MRSRLLAAFTTLCIGCIGTTDAPTPPSCDTPQSAADSLLVWQQESSYDIDKAVTCVDAPDDRKRRWAMQLKSVLDARGLYVPIDDMPDKADHTDAEGRAQVRPLADFPMVIVRGDDGQWRYSRSTMSAAPRLYASTFSPLLLRLQDQLPPVFFERFAGLYLWQFAFAAFLLAFAGLVGLLVRAVLYGRALQLAKRIGVAVDPATYRGTDLPLMLTASFSVLVWGTPQLQLPIGVSWLVMGAVDVALRLALIWLTMRLIDVGADVGQSWAARTESKLDDQLMPLLRSAAQTLVLVSGAFVIAGLFVDVWKLIAGASVGGLVVGLAAQDTVKNVFGSFNVFVDRPFQIGDFIALDGVEGVVEEVGFRSTRIRTLYNSQVSMPNSTLTNANIDNLGRRLQRRVRLSLGITYDTPAERIEAFVQGVRDILAAHPLVVEGSEVHLNDFSASSLDVLTQFHLNVLTWHDELEARAAVLLEVLKFAEREEVSFAFPTRTLHLASMPDAPGPIARGA